MSEQITIRHEPVAHTVPVTVKEDLANRALDWLGASPSDQHLTSGVIKPREAQLARDVAARQPNDLDVAAKQIASVAINPDQKELALARAAAQDGHTPADGSTQQQ